MPVSFTNPQLVNAACIWEATARKIGNVHRYADFGDTTLVDFLMSAAAISEPLDGSIRVPIGNAIWRAASQTRLTTGRNTNLGIILLLAPLVGVSSYFGLKGGLPGVLSNLSREDTIDVYNAIRLAQPGGLGDAPEQDVRDEPTVTLLEAMRLAADRDLIARQYANGFADVFDFGVPAFLAAVERFGCVEAAVIDCQLQWLAEHPDSLIARKNGPAVAEGVRQRVTEVLRLGGLETPEGRAAGVALDRHLRSDGNKLNPGTTADLVTACLFVALREEKVRPSAPFKWDVPDWL